MGIGWRGFRWFGQAVAVAAAIVLLSAAGLPIVAGAARAGHVKVYPAISLPGTITTGPDGALWFTNDALNSNTIGRITTSGKVTIYTGADINGPVGITTGPGGTLWFADNANSSVGRITTTVTP